ncbi:hypothetical protein CTA1_6587 [Colletotrichum tanaceti]|uniref:Uncharacterized protein n=1 Tax=Colletotrichum tanaceti TaxID=1306861 RepID=A0A4U6XG46_9PEZI|nr:hypothetical protein CTA1_6587 [Colletotrichum tanaceti]
MSPGPANETTSLLPPDPPRDTHTTHLLYDDDTTTTTTAHEETMSSQAYWRVGAVFGAAAVGIGAFGAHGLKGRISDPAKIASWSTAAQYQVRKDSGSANAAM